MLCRFSTKPSQGLHDNMDRSQGSRRLLADRSSVVSKFQAELLWNEGYRGELVKMGVFDTGIRLDHPHVKNIRLASHTTISKPLLPHVASVMLPCITLTKGMVSWERPGNLVSREIATALSCRILSRDQSSVWISGLYYSGCRWAGIRLDYSICPETLFPPTQELSPAIYA